MSLKVINSFIFCVSILIGVSGIYACGDTLTSPEQVVFPDSDVSYQRHVYPYMQLSCGYVGCHSSENPVNGIAFGSYSQVIVFPGFISPGKPAESTFVQFIENKLPHSAAPFQFRTNDNHKKGIRLWITEGARNN